MLSEGSARQSAEFCSNSLALSVSAWRGGHHSVLCWMVVVLVVVVCVSCCTSVVGRGRE